MSFEQELDIYLRSRFTLIVLVTPEEERALQAVKAVCERSQRPCISWDVADGFLSLTKGNTSLPTAKDPMTALEQIEKAIAMPFVLFSLMPREIAKKCKFLVRNGSPP